MAGGRPSREARLSERRFAIILPDAALSRRNCPGRGYPSRDDPSRDHPSRDRQGAELFLNRISGATRRLRVFRWFSGRGYTCSHSEHSS